LNLLLLGAPVGGDPSEFRRDLWRQKTRVLGLSYGIVFVILRLAILVQCRLVTDGRTERRTDRQTDSRRQHRAYTTLASRRAVKRSSIKVVPNSEHNVTVQIMTAVIVK